MITLKGVTCMADENKKPECVYAENYTNVGWRSDREREVFAALLFLEDIEDWKSEGSD